MPSANATATLQGAVARGLAALPRPATRLLVGRPIERDGQQLDVEAQLAVKLLKLSGAPELEELDVATARARVARDAAALAGPTVPVGETRELTVAGAAGGMAARLYVPLGSPAVGGLAVFFHGGGFVVGDLDSHDNACRFLASRAGTRVLAVDYRLAPEHRFPAAIDDATAAFRDIAERAGELGCDPNRLAVAGDSAGGNLAAGVALAAARDGGPAPAFQLLIYPWLDLYRKRESYRLFQEGFYLSESDLDWYRRHYLSAEADARDPRCSPLQAGDLAGAAAAYIVTAGFDPLRDEGEEYARRLREAGVRTALRRHGGLIHGFFNTVAVGRKGREAMLEAAGALRLALAAG